MPDDISDGEETSTDSNSSILLHHYEEDNIPYVAEEYVIDTSHDRSEGNYLSTKNMPVTIHIFICCLIFN